MEVKDMLRIVWCNEPVLTTSQTAAAYGCSTDTLKHNFQRAKEQFKEGVHYFKVSGAALRALKEDLNEGKKNHLPAFSKMASCLYLWTKQGVARHCKMINTPKAWEVFNVLEQAYFGMLEGEITMPEGTIYPDIAAKPKIAQVESGELLNRIQKQFAKPCAELAIVYALLMSNLVVKIGYTSNPTERVKKIRVETKLEVIDFYSTRLMTLEEARTLEASLKEKYASECIGGEYFDVRFSDVCAEI